MPSGDQQPRLVPDPATTRLIALCHRRWTLPLLATFWRQKARIGVPGAKFVTLVHTLGLSRDSLSTTLHALIDSHNLVMRNPGYGHPMRPEYVLTPAGRQVAPWADRIIAAAAADADLLLRKWSLPVLFVLHEGGPQRFTALRRELGSPSPRALTQCLRALLAHRWVECDASHAPYRIAAGAAARPAGVLAGIAAWQVVATRLGEAPAADSES